jgi:hypothetical protein
MELVRRSESRPRRAQQLVVWCLAGALALSLGACVSQIAPSVFRVTAQKGTLDQLQRALAQQGAGVENLDPHAGIAQTPWEASAQNRDGTIWAFRYIITLAPEGETSEVTVAMDLRFCRGALGANPYTGRLDGSACERLPDGMTPAMYQDQLDRFAAGLRAALD